MFECVCVASLKQSLKQNAAKLSASLESLAEILRKLCQATINDFKNFPPPTNNEGEVARTQVRNRRNIQHMQT